MAKPELGTKRVCVSCLRSGKVHRPQRRLPFQMPKL